MACFAMGKSEKGKVSLYKAMTLDPNNPHGLSMIQEHCFPNATITPNTTGNFSIGQDPVVNIKPHPNLRKNYYMIEQKSGNKLFFRVGTNGCTAVCPTKEIFGEGNDKTQEILVIPSNISINGKTL